MSRNIITCLVCLVCAAVTARAQASGNISYSQTGGRARAAQNERAKRAVSKDDAPPTGTSMFVEASILMNVKADEHVAVFGVAEECATVPECNRKMEATVAAFGAELRRLGVADADVFVDFAAQNKIYGFALEGNLARERLVGFELKKNVAVHYRDKALLDKLVIAAAGAKIYDLIKVDYLVRDAAAVQQRLAEEAGRVIEQKLARYVKLLGLKVAPPGQIYADKQSIYFPTEMYDSYTAAESESIDPDYYRERDRYTVQRARKSRTFFFNPLNADGFDLVINPVVIEPVVQFTLYFKVKFEMEQPKSR